MGTGVSGQDATGWMQVAGLVGKASGAYTKTAGERAGYEYQSAVARSNAVLADAQAQDAIERGVGNEANTRMRTGQLRSTQRATLAARGIDITTGSAANILEGTDALGEIDALTVRANAAREAWGYQTQASNYRSNAGLLTTRAGHSRPWAEATSTLLTSGGTVAAGWYSTKNSWLMQRGEMNNSAGGRDTSGFA